MGISQFQRSSREPRTVSSFQSPRKRKRDILRQELALGDTYDRRRRKQTYFIYLFFAPKKYKKGAKLILSVETTI